MFHLKARVSAVVVAGVIGFGSAVVLAEEPATQPSNAELQAEVQQLKSQVQELKTDQAQMQQDEAQAVQQVISQADQNSELFDANNGDATSGYLAKRFFISSENGDFTFKPWVHIQVRYVGNYRDSNYPMQSGIEIRRARFGFDGNLFGKDFTYFINWATNRANGTESVPGGTAVTPVGGLPVLEEAWMKYHIPDSDFYAKAGQMHDPLDHENIVGSKYRAPEASLQGDIFGNTDTFTKAITVIYDPKQALRTEAGINDGMRSANTNFEDDPNNGNAYDGGVAGRVEYKLMGDWKDYDQLTAYHDSSDLLVVGGGIDYSYSDGAYYTICHTADLQYGNPDGWFAYLCYFGRYTNHTIGIPLTSNPGASFGTPGDLGADTYEPSVDCLLAYTLTEKFEPFVRYEYMHLQGTPAGSNNNVTDISVGANYYFYGHNLKFTGMATYLPTGIPISDTSSEVLLSNNKAEVVLIAQMQLLL
jgi:outer membrane murein-binding lipoprotein Lpp